MASFIENVNLLATKIDIIEESNDIFNEGVIPVLEEIAQLDLDEAIQDLRKGNYLGNRKLDINLALNMIGIDQDVLDSTPTIAEAIWTDATKTVQYSSATATFVDGVVIEVPFLFDGNPTTVSTHGDLLIQLNAYVNVAAVAQIDTISITLADSTLYTVTINGVAYSYTSGIGATVPSIITGLLTEINVTQTNGTVPVTATNGGTTVILTADVVGVAFTTTVSASLSTVNTTANVIAHTEESPFLAKLETTLISSFASPVVGEIIRTYDVIGQNSNIERIQLHAASGSFIEASPIYYWAKTTSAFQTLSMRAGDIIKLGNEIDNLILLANSIEQVLALQARIPELIDTYTNEVANGDLTLYNKLTELLVIHTQLTGLIAIYNDIKVGGTNYINSVGLDLNTANNVGVVATDLKLGVNSKTGIVAANIANVNATGGSIAKVNTTADNIANVNLVATEIVPNLAEILLAAINAATATSQAGISTTQAGISTTQAGIATTQAGIATTKSNEIKGITIASVSTGIAGSSASVAYNPLDGKFYFTIPQGTKGDKGDSFAVNSMGLFAQRALYDAQIGGFSFLALDTSMIYFKLSSTSGDWSVGSSFGKGDTGAQGEQGYGWLHGAGIPDNALGRDNDFYMNMANADVYIKVAETWNYFVNLSAPIDDTTVSALTTWSSSKISNEIAAKINISDIQDILTSTDATKPLSAKQGKVLKDLIDNLVTLLGSDDVTLDTLQEIVSFIKLNKTTLESLAVANIAGLVDALALKANQSETYTVLEINTLLAAKQATLVSGTNIKTINDIDITGGGNIVLDINPFTVGDVVISSDAAKYTAPIWLKCDNSYYSKDDYPALHGKLGYSNGISAQILQEVVTCKPLLERFSNYYVTLPNTFMYGEAVAFNNDESVAVVYHNTTLVRIYRLNTLTNKYVLVQDVVSPTSITSASVSASGNLIAFTYGNLGEMFKYNGTTYVTTGTISNAAYPHQVSAISDTDSFVIFGNVSSVMGKIYPITNGIMGVAVTGTSFSGAAYIKPEWLPNQNIVTFIGSSISMYSVSGTTATAVGTAISSISNLAENFISKDGIYTAVRATVSPYFRIYKNDSALGPTLIYSDVLDNTACKILFDGDRVCRIPETTAPIPNVYTINRTNNTVTKSTTAFSNPIASSGAVITNLSSNYKVPSMAGYLLPTAYSIPTFKWDANTSTYKMWCASPTHTYDLSYNSSRDYAIIKVGGNFNAYIVQIDPITLEPIPTSIKFIQSPDVLNSSTASNNYFTDCDDMFVCIQYSNPKIYKLDKVAYTFSVVTHSISLNGSNVSTSQVNISPNGEFIATIQSNSPTLYGAYKDGSGNYVNITAYTNGTDNLLQMCNWLNNTQLLIDDAVATGIGKFTFTSLSPTVTKTGLIIGGKTVYTHVASNPNGVVVFNDSLFSYYVQHPDGTQEFLADFTSAKQLLLSHDGKMIILDSIGYIYNIILNRYVKIGDVIASAFTSNDFVNRTSAMLNYDKGIINVYSAYRTTMLNKLPIFTFSTTLTESVPLAYIKTGVIV